MPDTSPTAAPASFTCPVCGARSWHPEDVRWGYCGACHDYTGRPPGLTVSTTPTEEAS